MNGFLIYNSYSMKKQETHYVAGQWGPSVNISLCNVLENYKHLCLVDSAIRISIYGLYIGQFICVYGSVVMNKAIEYCYRQSNINQTRHIQKLNGSAVQPIHS